MHALRTGLIAIVAATAAAAMTPAKAASLSTDLNVTITSAISFSCFDEVDVNLSAESFISAVGRNGTRPMPSLRRNARARQGRLIANGNRRLWKRGRFKFRRRVNLDLRNLCVYHTLGGANGARVTVEALDTRLETSGGSSIEVTRVRARDTEHAGAWRRIFNVRPSDLGMGVVRGIDVRLRLDLRQALQPGVYSSLTDGTFRITLMPNP